MLFHEKILLLMMTVFRLNMTLKVLKCNNKSCKCSGVDVPTNMFRYFFRRYDNA